jgi:hypothetical protein
MNDFFKSLAEEAGFIIDGDKVIGEISNIAKLLEVFKKALADY